MEGLKVVFVWCLVILAILYKVTALMCYECAPCNDPFDKTGYNVTEIECDGACIKTITHFHDLGEYVSRKCSATFEKDHCESLRGSNEICTCGKDLCNGAPRTTTVSITTFTTSLAIVVSFLAVWCI